MEEDLRKIGGKDNELISWQSIHQTEERKAVQICVLAKTKLIPAFVQLLRLLRNPTHCTESKRGASYPEHKVRSTGPHHSFPPSPRPHSLTTTASPNAAFHHHATAPIALDASAAPDNRLNPMWYDPIFEGHSTGPQEADPIQLSKCCQTLQTVCDQFHQQAQNVMFPIDWKQIRGVLPTFQFDRPRWTRLFLECEYSASRLLYAVICYLEQNATISENVHVVEYKEADFFFMRNVNDAVLGKCRISAKSKLILIFTVVWLF